VEVQVSGRRFIVQVSGRHSSADLAGIDQARERVRLSTVLRASVRDQAALQGLLHRVHDLGLSLVEVHEVDWPDSHSDSDRAFDVTVDGPVGATVESMLTDYIGPIRVSSRYSFADAVVMGKVLTRLLNRGADLEHTLEQPDSADLTIESN
jgi:hypothetical protein